MVFDKLLKLLYTYCYGTSYNQIHDFKIMVYEYM